MIVFETYIQTELLLAQFNTKLTKTLRYFQNPTGIDNSRFRGILQTNQI